MADKKHWLDWLAVGISTLSLTVATLPAYRTVLYQRDDIRLIVGDALKVKRDKGGLLMSQDQEFTFINSGNRPAVISEIYGELVLDLDPNAGCNNQFAKSIILNPTTQIVLKPGDVLPLRAKVVQEYPWEKDKDGFLFREDKEKQGSQYLVCIQIYVTTPDSSSVKWVQPLYSMQPNETWPSELVGRNEPLKVIQRTSWGFS
jgi:hypothetical protein